MEIQKDHKQDMSAEAKQKMDESKMDVQKDHKQDMFAEAKQ